MTDLEKLLTALGVKDGSVSEALERIAILQEKARQAHDPNARRVPVQGTRSLRKPDGTIEWDEHQEAWNIYDVMYRSGQSAERIAERGGFDFAELVKFLGHEPKTWKPR